MASPAQIVILNGTPRSGKSSIAAAIQETGSGVWMNPGVDHFMAMTPPQFRPGIGLRPGGERPDLEPLVVAMYAALYESIAAHSRLGLQVVVDVGHHDHYASPRHILADAARRLRGLPVLFVGVRCPLAVVLERRRATGWDAAGVPAAVERWQHAVHDHSGYDMELDTSQLRPAACAEAIFQRIQNGPPGSAFARFCPED